MIIKAKTRLNRKLIARVLKLKDKVAPQAATTYNSGHAGSDTSVDESYRRTEVRWLMHDAYPFIHRELQTIVSQHQGQLGVRQALAIEGGVQLATYYAGDHFDWHADGYAGDNTRRMISISVLLNTGFKGGELEFRRPNAPQLKKPGDIIMFNSDEQHRVAAVTEGVRESLVVWFRLP